MASFHVENIFLCEKLFNIMKQNKNKHYSQLTFLRMSYLIHIIT